MGKRWQCKYMYILWPMRRPKSMVVLATDWEPVIYAVTYPT